MRKVSYNTMFNLIPAIEHYLKNAEKKDIFLVHAINKHASVLNRHASEFQQTIAGFEDDREKVAALLGEEVEVPEFQVSISQLREPLPGGMPNELVFINYFIKD